MGVQYLVVDEAPEVIPGTTEEAVPEGEPMLEHEVVLNDLLPMLALRYHTTVAAIRLANGWCSNESFDFLAPGTVIRVPKAEAPPLEASSSSKDAKEEAMEAFMFMADCANPQVKREEARYYLENNGWDPRRAWEARRQDVQWEIAQERLQPTKKQK